jgi:septal ring factor EnvC (AmiA/AmiB activator)
LFVVGAFTLACTSKRDRARADSAQAVIAKQALLMTTLSAQRDSVSQVLDEADDFIDSVDNSISRGKGGGRVRVSHGGEGTLNDQIQARKEMLNRVDALVTRARETASQLEQVTAANVLLKAQIAEMKSTIAHQVKTIAALQGRLEDFGRQLAAERAVFNRAYYVIGTEDELIDKGVIEREGGTNILIRRIGRTLVPARQLNTSAFTTIDARDVHVISVPDSTRRYEIVSRQSLDNGKVMERDGTTFRGSLAIPDADKFWGPSRYLILVER